MFNSLRLIALIGLVISLPNLTGSFERAYLPELNISIKKTTVFLSALKDSQIEKINSIEFNAVTYEELKIKAVQPEVQIIAATESNTRIFKEGITLSKSNILFLGENTNHQRKERLIASLTPAQANRLMGSGSMNEILEEDYSAPTVREVARELVWQEVKSTKKQNQPTYAQKDKSLEWNTLEDAVDNVEKYVYYRPRRNKKPIQEQNKSSGSAGYVASNTPKKESPADKSFTGEEDYGFTTMAAVNEPNTDSNYKHKLSGTFSFINGVAFVPGLHEVHIYQEADDLVIAQGQYNLNAGTFEMVIDSLRGDLVAEIADIDGFKVAEARVSIDNMPTKEYSIRGFNLALSPYYNGWNIKTISAYSSEKNIQSAANIYFDYAGQDLRMQTNSSGHFQNQYVENGSTANLEFKSNGHWSTLKHIESGATEHIPVFEDSMIEAMIATLREQGMEVDPYSNGIVWGKVKTKGRAGSGVKVKISDRDSYGPAYLNEVYIAQKDLLYTTRNGYFIFVGVRPGIHTLDFEYKGERIAKAIEVKAHSVSYMTLDLNSKVKQQLSIKEIDKTIESEIDAYIVGNSDSQLIKGQPMMVHSAKSSTMNLFEFRLIDGEFVYRTHLPQSLDKIALQILPESLMAKFYDNNNWSNALIGFIDGKDFSAVFLNQQSVENKIIYFDASGNLIPTYDLVNREADIVGFILPSIASGTHQIQIYNQDGRHSSQHIIMSEGLIYALPI